MIVNIILGIIGLGIVIVIHETGHFIAAKLFGVSVEVFSIGWGKSIFSWKRKDTEYRISLLPIGGYCRMKGGDLLQKAIQEKSSTIPEEEGSFYSASPLKRAGISFSGSFFNLISAIIIFSLIWWAGFSVQSYGNRVVLVSDYNIESGIYPADTAGLKTGDQIVEIEGREIRNYNDIKEIIATNAGNELETVIIREGQTKQITLVPQKDPDTGIGLIGVYAWIDPVIGAVAPDSPAAIAGLKTGDIIIKINDADIAHSIDVLSQLSDKPEKISITVERNGGIYTKSLFLSYTEAGDPDLGFIFHINKYPSDKKNLVQAFGQGFSETFSTLRLTVKSIGMLFSGINVREAVSGPIRLTYYVGAVASQGFETGLKDGFVNMFRFLSLLSVFFFFMNLLPIPALDGGHLVLQLIEGITKKPPKPSIIYRYQVIGFTILIGILIFSTLNDVTFFLNN